MNSANAIPTCTDKFSDNMKTFGLAVLGGIFGYVVGLFGGMALVSVLSSNTHDKSMEVVMTGFFVIGPLMAATGFVGTLVFRLVKSR